MDKKIECPECRDEAIDFYTGKCDKCGYTLSHNPKEVAEQYVENIVINYQLEKLQLKEDDLVIIRPKMPVTEAQAQDLIDIFQSSIDIPFYVIIMNEHIKLEKLNDEELGNIGLKRIEEE